ncbi:hypothetical protein [Arthrobacter sp. CJ23]|uniref:DUF6414 family protein n=1 Tax=Arthrobacter sp. CJ23 TaxID=2972479 RepID=UPI00215D51B5|nr:hypothetical protein [Arthrobacter sp. CJ23]UVJ40233.1 hypothetical protein NVV90_03330 [Arthrobacter sp. CJ23]
MLKNFLYLNEPMLDGFLSALGAGSPKAAGAGSGVEQDGQDSADQAATPEAKFEQLLKLARRHAKASAWITVADVDADLKEAHRGAILELECEIFVPDAAKAFSPWASFPQLMEQLEAYWPFAGMMNPGAKRNLQEHFRAKGMGAPFGSHLVFVGDIEGTDVRIAGKLIGTHLRGDIDGYAHVVGKVTTQWDAGRWKPLISVPDMDPAAREKRRETEQNGPAPGQEQNWLEGPAFMLDVLAIYR